ncbi:MAG TPA: nucleotidyltransferase domain-containing protein [Candidatus Coprenecus merdipullorum]|nr:nucleotidyltransferase domain-containing protein [Candidatus Coprenecus merdipullorum]
MKSSDILKEIKRIAKEVLPKGARLILYGSRARNEADEASDWDLLILLDKPKIDRHDRDEVAYPFRALSWDVVANRLYYAVFHAVSALLIKDGYKVGTHKGAMLMFGQHYVRTGIFTAEESKLYSNLQMMREESDYNCVYVTTAEEM